MRILFFDIDGVLNTNDTPNPRKLPYIVDKRLVARFKRVLLRTKARPVMTSTWRYDPAGLFSARHHGIPFIDVTPDFPKRPRRAEILAWIKQHPRVTRYAIVDDDDDGLDGLPLFQPAPAKGFSPEIAKGLTAYLLGESDQIILRNKLVRVAENMVDMLTRHKG